MQTENNLTSCSRPLLNTNAMNKGAIISECDRYRYQLWRIWNADRPLVLFICLNPSKADGHSDDPTLRRLMRFAGSWGFGGLLLGNLFAYRATRPRDMRAQADPFGPANTSHLLEMKARCEDVVFAWGTHGGYLDANKLVIELFKDSAPKCICKTINGHPQHPLFLPKHLKPRLFSDDHMANEN